MSLLPARIHAAPLIGRGWLNTGGDAVDLADLRGSFVLLDFWTFCCINCLHVLDELRGLHEQFADVLTIIGVHSPKFAHEADPAALAAAVERYGVDHPVVDDADLATWQGYGARAWPTLTLIDPNGYVAAQMSGEGHAQGLEVLLRQLIAEHEAAGTLRRASGPYLPPAAEATALRFPGKVLALPGGTFAVSDTAHHQIVELAADLTAEIRRIGSGRRGFDDGSPSDASFCQPQGLMALPTDVAATVGYDLVVADTANHALRGISLTSGAVRTVAGTGQQLRQRSGGGDAKGQPLSSPWDVAWFAGAVTVAMAGTHQLWRFDPVAGTVAVVAGTSAEGLLDGPATRAHFAQPSGVAASADPTRLWVVDAETSALRHVSADEPDSAARGSGQAAGLDLAVVSDVGAGLFDFGHVDGPAADARFQHPLGVVELPDGSVAVCDTYNGAIRRFDPASGEVTTIATGLSEPSGAALDVGGHAASGYANGATSAGRSDGVAATSTDSDDPTLVVVESGAHRLVRVRVPRAALRVQGGMQHSNRPATLVSAGEVTVWVSFTPPSGQKLDDRFGDPTRLDISASPASLLVAGGGTGAGLSRTIRLSDSEPGGVLHVSVQAAACDGDPASGTIGEFAACHLYQQDWGIPVVIDANGDSAIALPLRAIG